MTEQGKFRPSATPRLWEEAAPHITFESPWLDLYLSIGATIQALNTLMCGNDNIEIRWCNGTLALYMNGVQESIVGTRDVEVAADEFSSVLRMLGRS